MKIEDKDILAYCPRCGKITNKGYTKYCECNKGKIIKMVELNPKETETLHQKFHEIFHLQKVQYVTDHAKNWYIYCESFVNEVIRKNPEFSETAYKQRWCSILKNERQEIITRMCCKYERQIYGENFETMRLEKGIYGQFCPYCGGINLKKISLSSRINAYLNMGMNNPLKGRTHQCEYCGLVFKLIPRSAPYDFYGFYIDLIQEYSDNDDDFSSDPYATHSPDYPITFSQCCLPKDKQL